MTYGKQGEPSIFQIIPVIDYTVRELCVRPYPLHPNGCPNVGRCDRCPPAAPLYDQVYDLTKPCYALVNEFDFEGHVARMRGLHPNWSIRQLTCVLYWQPRARKQLEEHIKRFLLTLPADLFQYRDRLRVERCPEAMGVNITETLAAVGIQLEWPPVRVARQVAVIGVLKLT